MKKHRVKVEKGANAKIVVKGAIVEIKKVNNDEVEIIFPDGVRFEEIVNYLHKFNVIKPRPHDDLEFLSESKDSAEHKEISATSDQQDQATDEQKENEQNDQVLANDNKSTTNEEVKDEETSDKNQKQKTSTRKRTRQ